MNKNQKKVFVASVVSFALFTGYFFSELGYFENLSTVELAIFFGFLGICILPMYLWIKSNAKAIDSAFKKLE